SFLIGRAGIFERRYPIFAYLAHDSIFLLHKKSRHIKHEQTVRRVAAVADFIVQTPFGSDIPVDLAIACADLILVGGREPFADAGVERGVGVELFHYAHTWDNDGFELSGK